MRSELDIVLRVDLSSRRSVTVRGEVESRYGRQPFAGWLELLGHVEGLVDRARDDAQRARGGDGTSNSPPMPSDEGGR